MGRLVGYGGKRVRQLAAVRRRLVELRGQLLGPCLVVNELRDQRGSIGRRFGQGLRLA